MRLDILYEDRCGLTLELLEVLVSLKINVRGIELNSLKSEMKGIQEKLYLHCLDVEFDSFRHLMSQIRLLPSVLDVKKTDFLPNDKKNEVLFNLVMNWQQVVLAINVKVHIEMVNKAGLALFSQCNIDILRQKITNLLPQWDFMTWLQHQDYQKEKVFIKEIEYQMEVMPLITEKTKDLNELDRFSLILQPLVTSSFVKKPSISQKEGFEHIIGQSNKHRQLLLQAKKFSSLNQPLLI